MSNLKFQRDEFINTIYNKAKKNKNIYFLSADFGAPALDQFRENLKKQFIHDRFEGRPIGWIEFSNIVMLFLVTQDEKKCFY